MTPTPRTRERPVSVTGEALDFLKNAESPMHWILVGHHFEGIVGVYGTTGYRELLLPQVSAEESIQPGTGPHISLDVKGRKIIVASNGDPISTQTPQGAYSAVLSAEVGMIDIVGNVNYKNGAPAFETLCGKSRQGRTRGYLFATADAKYGADHSLPLAWHTEPNRSGPLEVDFQTEHMGDLVQHLRDVVFPRSIAVAAIHFHPSDMRHDIANLVANEFERVPAIVRDHTGRQYEH